MKRSTEFKQNNIRSMVKLSAKIKFFAVAVLASALTIGCASSDKSKGNKGASPVFYGLAIVKPTKDNKVSGRVYFAEAFGKVKVHAELSGLDKNSKHGIHIHEFGDCSADDGSSAGGHYNPSEMQHGAPDNEIRHAGDLGNLETDKKGNAVLDVELSDSSINGNISPLIGRAVIVHKNADDLISQPTGGAGARIGCGVIGAAAGGK